MTATHHFHHPQRRARFALALAATVTSAALWLPGLAERPHVDIVPAPAAVVAAELPQPWPVPVAPAPAYALTAGPATGPRPPEPQPEPAPLAAKN